MKVIKLSTILFSLFVTVFTITACSESPSSHESTIESGGASDLPNANKNQTASTELFAGVTVARMTLEERTFFDSVAALPQEIDSPEKMRNFLYFDEAMDHLHDTAYANRCKVYYNNYMEAVMRLYNRRYGQWISQMHAANINDSKYLLELEGWYGIHIPDSLKRSSEEFKNYCEENQGFYMHFTNYGYSEANMCAYKLDEYNIDELMANYEEKFAEYCEEDEERVPLSLTVCDTIKGTEECKEVDEYIIPDKSPEEYEEWLDSKNCADQWGFAEWIDVQINYYSKDCRYLHVENMPDSNETRYGDNFRGYDGYDFYYREKGDSYRITKRITLSRYDRGNPTLKEEIEKLYSDTRTSFSTMCHENGGTLTDKGTTHEVDAVGSLDFFYDYECNYNVPLDFDVKAAHEKMNEVFQLLGEMLIAQQENREFPLSEEQKELLEYLDQEY